jgi:hypothetical protein
VLVVIDAQSNSVTLPSKLFQASQVLLSTPDDLRGRQKEDLGSLDGFHSELLGKAKAFGV